AVFLRRLLDAASRRRTVGLLVVAGLLAGQTAVRPELRLAPALVGHRLLDGLPRVGVLGLGAGAELLLAAGARRRVGVDAHGALVHAGIGDAERLDQVAQRRHVCAGYLGGALACADDGLGDDLDQRHARTVAVDQRPRRAMDAARGAAQ